MSDKAHKATDKLLNDLEKELKTIYQNAYNKTKKELDKKLSKLGDLSKIENPTQRLALINKRNRLQSLIKLLSKEIQNSNKIAMSLMQENLLNVYGENHNYAAYLVENLSGYEVGYTFYNKAAIKRILAGEESPFLQIALDDIKDRNTIIKELRRQLTEAVLLGESPYKIAQRIKKVTEKNMNNSMRIARTETTRVENAAREDAFKQGEKLGLNLKKKWISTLDSRTRSSHQHLMGEEIGLDDVFSNGLRFPGDYLGSAKEVVNCRCTMVTEFVDFEKTPEEKKLDERLKKMTYEEWSKERDV